MIVGVDGSPSSLAAADAAAEEARLRGARLRIVHAFARPSDLDPMIHGVLADTEQRLRERVPGLEITRTVVSGDVLTVLRTESRHAVLTVLGRRGRSLFGDLLLGSTTMQLAAHGHGPLMVVRGRPDPQGPVLLAADGSPAGNAAASFAFTEAELRGAPLMAMHVWNTWSEPTPYEEPGDPLSVVVDLGQLETRHRRLLEDAMKPWMAAHPDVIVQPRLERGRVRQALLEATREAQLVVAGARGHGGVAGMLLGSVSQALLHHAECPVTVVRAL
ncbi:universal stress protein [Streptomyces sp. SID8376]|nr:universal stress protein [Streptomyces sp. McG7]MBT2903563.1 universal stress protein [Streptomyces sp. McG8]MXQ59779.1 universal stress protein [Streptomyces sp. XHT-2]MYQ32835.1 universal stress protein [Streptomyces sp. SID4956]MYW51520.1 universal stress protein [Streptomyces sp. SID8376]THC59546.1 universal stress protein [Streptomyces sp. Akac8]